MSLQDIYTASIFTFALFLLVFVPWGIYDVMKGRISEGWQKFEFLWVVCAICWILRLMSK